MTSPGPDRRTVLRSALAGTVVAAAAASGLTPADASPQHLLPSARSGPTRADWRALARHIDGDVVRRGDASFARVSHVFNPLYDDRRPLAVVEATSAQDVHEAIRFARRFGLRPRPKAGGHSYVGASTGQQAFVIDVKRIHQVRIDSGSATVGAGASLYDVHASLARHHRTIPTGTCPTVGTAGLALGGGLGVASREHGLTCDSLTGLTMVTADGQIRVVNASHHPNLFWASRGGGGGNFGIVTSMRFDTQVARRTGFFLLSFPWSHAEAVVRGWAHRVKQMPRSAWANLHLEAGSNGSTRVRIVGTCRPGAQHHEAQALEAAVGVAASSVSTFEKPFLEGVQFLGGGTTSPRTAFAAGSDIVEDMTPRLARILVRVVAQRAASGRSAAAILDPLTGAVRDVGVHSTAFPWRRHLCDIQWYVGLSTGAGPSAVHAAHDWIRTAHSALGRHTVGAYVNYLEPQRSVRSYYGVNYARLRQIKAAVDPGNLFSSAYSVR